MAVFVTPKIALRLPHYMMALSVALLAYGTASCSKSISEQAVGVPDGPTLPNTVPTPALRIYHDPYAGINWATTYRLKSQHHDHVGDGEVGLLAYDAAGYDVVSLMNYSGVQSLSYAWHEARWPSDTWLSPSLRAKLKNIKFFIPNSESVGYSHITTPFLTQYIEKWEPAYSSVKRFYQYGGPTMGWITSTQEAIKLVDSLGGMPFIAHPWTGWVDYESYSGYKGTEIYNGYVTYKLLEGADASFASDLNIRMQEVWDRMLMRDQTIIGIAVNDHFGPDFNDPAYTRRLRDSGKILVLAPDKTYAAYVPAFKKGAILAVKDYGEKKDLFPNITSIAVESGSITINTTLPTDNVQWIANGTAVATTPHLVLSDLPQNTLYVRAVVSNADGSQVFTQAFGIRKVKDTNGDGVVDAADVAVCAAVNAGKDTDADHISACNAIIR